MVRWVMANSSATSPIVHVLASDGVPVLVAVSAPFAIPVPFSAPAPFAVPVWFTVPASLAESVLVMSVRMLYLYVYVNVKHVGEAQSDVLPDSRRQRRAHQPMFELSKDHEDFRAVVREFAETEVAPHIASWDREDHFPVDLIPKMGDLGLFGRVVPEEFGGADPGDGAFTFLCVAIEELGRVD